MQLEENASRLSTSRLHDIHPQRGIHLQGQSPDCEAHRATTCRQTSWRSNTKQWKRTEEQQCNTPGSICPPSHRKLVWRLLLQATWWTVCINTDYLTHTEHLDLIFCGCYVSVCNLRRRSRQSSCRWLILSAPKCRVPQGPSHTRRFMATRRALIWKHRRYPETVLQHVILQKQGQDCPLYTDQVEHYDHWPTQYKAGGHHVIICHRCKGMDQLS